MKNKVLVFWKKYSYLIMLSNLLIGLIHPMVALIFTICMMGPAVVGFFTGRFWCGSICPIGNFFDKVTIKTSRGHKVPKIFKSTFLKIIIAITMIIMFIYDMKSAWGNGNRVGFIYFEMIMESIIIGTLLSLLYNHRVWCHFCPMGSMGSLMAKFSKNKKVLEVSADCINCGKCSDNCPMGVSPSDFKDNKINSPDCIQCRKCVYECPQKSISYDRTKFKNNFLVNEKLTIKPKKNSVVVNTFEENMVISIIFTLPIIILSMNMFSSHLLSTTASLAKIAITKLILTSIVMLSIIDFLQLGLTSLFKGHPNRYSVIATGIISWYAYQVLVVYLVLTVNPAFTYNINLSTLAIIITCINIIRYLKVKRN
ncbi:4Fe-4S binding protein [Clostridium chromiireducens]|uniref:4Fe-4S binding protein n=1 Tax=Clostridium chromiireducens TaxID=225345 RepID=A0A399IIB6_9CLOT|nr:4Fe-4S binding protein [Clostridium chromiireducens]RII32591.1 4Fe-4S binding protein [Clostridium chromiireducens]